MLDNGSVFYAPLGIDIWALLPRDPTTASHQEGVAQDFAEHYFRALPGGVGTSVEHVRLAALAGACLMRIDRYQKSVIKGRFHRLDVLQEVALRLIERAAHLRAHPA